MELSPDRLTWDVELELSRCTVETEQIVVLLLALASGPDSMQRAFKVRRYQGLDLLDAMAFDHLDGAMEQFRAWGCGDGLFSGFTGF